MRPLHTHWGGHNQNQMLTSGVEDVGKLDLSYVAGKNVKWGSRFGKQSESALEANHELLYVSATLLSGIYQDK